eukprot:g4177.t1
MSVPNSNTNTYINHSSDTNPYPYPGTAAATGLPTTGVVSPVLGPSDHLLQKNNDNSSQPSKKEGCGRHPNSQKEALLQQSTVYCSSSIINHDKETSEQTTQQQQQQPKSQTLQIIETFDSVGTGNIIDDLCVDPTAKQDAIRYCEEFGQQTTSNLEVWKTIDGCYQAYLVERDHLGNPIRKLKPSPSTKAINLTAQQSQQQRQQIQKQAQPMGCNTSNTAGRNINTSNIAEHQHREEETRMNIDDDIMEEEEAITGHALKATAAAGHSAKDHQLLAAGVPLQQQGNGDNSGIKTKTAAAHKSIGKLRACWSQNFEVYIGEKIGAGSFGQIHLGYCRDKSQNDTSTKSSGNSTGTPSINSSSAMSGNLPSNLPGEGWTSVVVKVEQYREDGRGQLQQEYKIYRYLQNYCGRHGTVPRRLCPYGLKRYPILYDFEKNALSMHFFDKKRDVEDIVPCNILIIERLGTSLETRFQDCHRRFSTKTVCMLAIQMIDCLELLHGVNYIHRDIKPDNFLLGGEGKSRQTVYIIDFGLSKRYWNPTNPPGKRHIPPCTGKQLTGTARYCSINTHRGHEQSRRDDLEALGHVLLYFMTGAKLPWQGLNRHGTSKLRKYRLIHKVKEETAIGELCSSMPKAFASYMSYCRKLGFAESPSYSYLRKLFLDEMGLNSIEDVYNEKFCWEMEEMDVDSFGDSVSKGAHVEVIVACRDPLKARKDYIEEHDIDVGIPRFEKVDLADLDSVMQFCQNLIAEEGGKTIRRLRMIVNNAGTIGSSFTEKGPILTPKHGIEVCWQVNYVGHFLLTKILLDKIASIAKRVKANASKNSNPSSPSSSPTIMLYKEGS